MATPPVSLSPHPSSPQPAPDTSLRQQMHSDLHDLCQPLTALQFKLEITRIVGGPEALQQAIDGSLEETRRLFDAIDTMRHHLLRYEAGKQ
jgi:hypothetical protein